MLDKMIIDADLCIKLGGSDKYRYLYDILPLVAKTIYMHTHAYGGGYDASVSCEPAS